MSRPLGAIRPWIISEPQHARPIQRPLMHETREQQARELAEEKAAVLAVSAAAGVHPNDPSAFGDRWVDGVGRAACDPHRLPAWAGVARMTAKLGDRIEY